MTVVLPPRILIVGIGNPIRSDDGIGAYICIAFENLNLAGVKTLATQQLHTELIEDFLQYDHIILADAAVNGISADLYPLDRNQTDAVSSSHHINAAMLLALTKQLYNRSLSIMCCAVKGEDFKIGENISPSAKINADEAIAKIQAWIFNGCR